MTDLACLLCTDTATVTLTGYDSAPEDDTGQPLVRAGSCDRDTNRVAGLLLDNPAVMMVMGLPINREPCPACGRELPQDPLAMCVCKMCRVCGAKRASSRGRCSTCYEYRRRTGKDRSVDVRRAWGERQLARRVG